MGRYVKTTRSFFALCFCSRAVLSASRRIIRCSLIRPCVPCMRLSFNLRVLDPLSRRPTFFLQEHVPEEDGTILVRPPLGDRFQLLLHNRPFLRPTIYIPAKASISSAECALTMVMTHSDRVAPASHHCDLLPANRMMMLSCQLVVSHLA